MNTVFVLMCDSKPICVYAYKEMAEQGLQRNVCWDNACGDESVYEIVELGFNQKEL